MLEKIASTSPSTKKGEPPKISRRGFLGLLGRAAAGAAIGLSGIDKAFADEQSPQRENQTENKDKFELIKSVDRIQEIALEERIKIGKPNAQNHDLTTQELANIRLLVEPYLTTVHELILQTKDDFAEDADSLSPGSINWILAKLQSSNSHGVVFGALQAKGVLKKVCEALPAEYFTEDYYAITTKDYLPTPENIFDFEIDPRLGMAKYHPDEKEGIEKEIKDTPGWTNQQKIESFKQVLGNKKVRDVIIRNDLNLSEAYSLIKAALNLQEHYPETEITEIIDKILDAQKKFKTKQILHSETNYFIHAHNDEKWVAGNPFQTEPNTKARFDGETFDQVAEAAGVKKENTRRIEGSDSDAVRKLLDSISLSSYETTIYINGHGEPNDLALNDSSLLSVEDLARSLLARLRLTKKPEDLSQITLIIDACHSYDFGVNLFSAIEKEYNSRKDDENDISHEIPFTQISMPTVVTSTQRDSVGFTTEFCPEKMLKKHLPAIKDEGALTGEFLLERIQPAVYPFEDMTVLLGMKGGYTEIAELTNRAIS